jgi:hypothetical protein
MALSFLTNSLPITSNQPHYPKTFGKISYQWKILIYPRPEAPPLWDKNVMLVLGNGFGAHRPNPGAPPIT